MKNSSLGEEKSKVEKTGADAPLRPGLICPPDNNLYLPPEEFGRRGQFYFGLSAFEGFELMDAFAGESDPVCGVDDSVEYRICHCSVTDGIVPVQFGEL